MNCIYNFSHFVHRYGCFLDFFTTDLCVFKDACMYLRKRYEYSTFMAYVPLQLHTHLPSCLVCFYGTAQRCVPHKHPPLTPSFIRLSLCLHCCRVGHRSRESLVTMHCLLRVKCSGVYSRECLSHASGVRSSSYISSVNMSVTR